MATNEATEASIAESVSKALWDERQAIRNCCKKFTLGWTNSRRHSPEQIDGAEIALAELTLFIRDRQVRG